MKIICRNVEPNESQAKTLGIGKYYFPGQEVFPVEIGREYTVYGLSILGGSVWVDIVEYQRDDFCVLVPLCLFGILDDRLSKYWHLRILENGEIYLLPEVFYTPYFQDDLTEGVPEAVDGFKQIKELIDMEFSSPIE